MSCGSNSSCSKKLWNVVFVLGPPGSGKGTQCSKIVENFGYTHLSAGELLREEMHREGSQFGELIDRHIKNGIIVPVAVTCKLLENAMIANPNNKGYLIDGFPRNQDNLDGWTEEMSDKTKVQFVLFLQCSETVCVNRCLNRGEGRTDDNEDSLKQRFNTYSTQTMPIVDHFDKLNLVQIVDATKSAEEVTKEVSKIFEKYVVN